MVSIPDIPEQFSWAWDEEVVSSHSAVPAAAVRISGAQYFLAICLVCLSGVGFFIPAKEGIVVSYSMGVLCLVGALAVIVWGFLLGRSLVRLVDVYPSGVLWLGKDDWLGARWEQIDEVLRAEIYVNGGLSTKVVTIKTVRGEKASFQHLLRDWGKMADAIVMQTATRQLPRAVERFAAGEWVHFGTVAISKEGLEFPKKRFRFDEIAQITIGNGHIWVFPANVKQGQSISFAKLPNYLVFLKLLELSPAPRPLRS